MDFPAIPPKPLPATPGRAVGPEPQEQREAKLRESAEAFEATFIAEMLKHTGVNRTPESLGGGAGEDAFGSFLTQAYAEEIAARGGFGLSEQIFNALNSKESK